jgi:hypothetical protein
VDGYLRKERRNRRADGFLILEIISGGEFSTIGTPYPGLSTGVKYDYIVTRTPAGLFEVYLRGGALATHTLVITGTDNTHTEGRYTGFSLRNTDKVLFAPIQGRGSIVKGLLI